MSYHFYIYVSYIVILIIISRGKLLMNEYKTFPTYLSTYPLSCYYYPLYHQSYNKTFVITTLIKKKCITKLHNSLAFKEIYKK